MKSQKQKRKEMVLRHLTSLFNHIRNAISCPYEEPPVYMHPVVLGAGKLGQLVIVYHARDHHFKRTCLRVRMVATRASTKKDCAPCICRQHAFVKQTTGGLCAYETALLFGAQAAYGDPLAHKTLLKKQVGTRPTVFNR